MGIFTNKLLNAQKFHKVESASVRTLDVVMCDQTI